MKVLTRTLDEEQTIREFKKVLWVYDFWGRFTESKAAGKVLELADITNGDAVLDVACGTGEMLEKVVALNPDGENAGVDLSPDMLAKATKKLSKTGNKVDLKENSAMKLDFSDHRFDVLINNYMVDLLPVDTFGTIANEFFRVLKPGGKVVMSTFSFGTRKVHRFWFWVAKHFPALLTGCRPVSFKKYLEKAGFTIEQDIEISQNTFSSQVLLAVKRQ